jgi:hypothetical protein
MDPRGRVWCHVLCQALSVAAGLGVVAAVPHIDPNLAFATAVEAPKLLGGPDREDPRAPEWVTLETASGAATGTAGELPPFSPRTGRHVGSPWHPAYYQRRQFSLPGGAAS